MRNKTLPAGVFAFAVVIFLAGCIVGARGAGASVKPAKKAATHRVRLLLSYGTLTADKFAYKYQDGEILSIRAYGHVKLEVPKYNFIGISQAALFTPNNAPASPNNLLQLVGSPNSQASCRLAGNVTMGDDARYRYDEHFGKYVWHRGWLKVGWLTYIPGANGMQASLAMPGPRTGEAGITAFSPVP